MIITVTEFQDSFKDFISKIDDPRLDRTKKYSLAEIMFLALVATLAGAKGWRAMEYFGLHNLELLREFYQYEQGSPSDDTIRRLFRRLGHRAFRDFFDSWVQTLVLPEKMAIAIDGKTSRSSQKESGCSLHTVSAYASEQRLVLAQEKTNDKSNEITAIPKLLDAMSIQDAIITIDAMGCQKDICAKIILKEADYCIAVKENQPSLYNSIIDLFEMAEEKKIKVKKAVTQNKGHGRKEKRICEVMLCPKDFLATYKKEWKGIKALVKITSHRLVKEKESISVRYYISSNNLKAAEMNKVVRGHCAVENNFALDTRHYI